MTTDYRDWLDQHLGEGRDPSQCFRALQDCSTHEPYTCTEISEGQFRLSEAGHPDVLKLDEDSRVEALKFVREEHMDDMDVDGYEGWSDADAADAHRFPQ